MNASDSADLEEYKKNFRCAECGYYRNGAHHPSIKCPKTGRCGTCGNPWPCVDHIVKADTQSATVSEDVPGNRPANPTTPSKYVLVTEAAQILGVTESTVYKLQQRGKIRASIQYRSAKKEYRFHRSSILEYMAEKAGEVC